MARAVNTTGTAAPPYTADFVTADWALVGANRVLTYTSGVHGQGAKPFIHVAQLVGADHEDVGVQTTTTPTGDITISVPDGNEYDGRVMVSAGLAGIAPTEPVYTATFLAAGWVPAGSLFALTVPAATHGIGATPRIQISESVGGGVHRSIGIQTDVTAAGDITFTAAAAFDGRYTLH